MDWDKKARLAELAKKVEECRNCPLGAQRTRSVFSSGNPLADVLFVGEGPGKWEDRLGEAFVGDAGEHLDRLLAKAGWTRNQVYIINTIKCRATDPKGEDRTPNKTEVKACLPWLQETIYIVDPVFIVTAGKVPAAALGGFRSIREAVKDTFDVTIRGRRYDLRYPAMAIYHPSALLRGGNSFDLFMETVDQLRHLRKTVEAYRRLALDQPSLPEETGSTQEKGRSAQEGEAT